MLHHHSQEADDDFLAGPDNDLEFIPFFCLADAFQSTGQYVYVHHDDSARDDRKSKITVFDCMQQTFFLTLSG